MTAVSQAGPPRGPFAVISNGLPCPLFFKSCRAGKRPIHAYHQVWILIGDQIGCFMPPS